MQNSQLNIFQKLKKYSLRLVVRLLAQTEQLLRLPGVLALRAYELRQRLAALLRYADAVAVEPVVAQVAADVELGLVVRRPTHAVQLLLFAAGTLRRRGRLRLLDAGAFLAAGRRPARVLREDRRGGGGGGGRGLALAAARAHLVLLVALELRSGREFFGYFLLFFFLISV